MTYPFGRALTVPFYPLIEGDAYAPSLTTGALVSAYLFDRRPTPSEAASGSGALALSVPSWTWDANQGAFLINVPAVPDPDPTSLDPDRIYFLAVTWRLEALAQVQTTLLPIEFERLTAQGAALVVTTADLEDYYPDVRAYATDNQLAATVSQAAEDVRTRLQNLGYRWANLSRPDRLKQVVVLRSLSIVMLAQAQNSSDKFFAKYGEYKAMYVEALDGLKFEYDANGDGVPDAAEASSAGGGIGLLYVVR